MREVKKVITKCFDTLRQAEQYQNWLYSKYDHVQLIRSPFIGETGQYAWEIRKRVEDKT